MGMSNYKLAKLSLPFFDCIKLKLIHRHRLITFAKEICKQDRNLYMTSLEVDSLITIISPAKTIEICIDSLYKDDISMFFVISLPWSKKNCFLCLAIYSINKLMVRL